MANFDWHEEEDIRWGDQPQLEPKRPARRWPRWLLLLLIVMAGTGVAVTAVYRQLTNRVEEVSFAEESAIRRSHDLVYQSAQQQDRELFVTLLSGRDDAWATAQERVVGAGLLYARNGFSLVWLPGNPETAVADIEISPDLTMAVLTATHQYAIDVGNNLTQTVTLLQTAVYRRGSDRWLFSPPDADFWGNSVTSQGELLTMSYPARDTAVAQRLAADIEAKINEMCRLEGLECPHDLHLRVELTTSPTAVYETNRPPEGFTLNVPPSRSFGWYSIPGRLEEKAGTLTLPTPTMFGLPQDEAGYQALYRGYGARALSMLIADLVGWKCCEEHLFFQAALDMELAQLGLHPWQVEPGDYTAVLGTSVGDVYQNGLLGDITSLHMVVAFMAQALEVPPVMVQQKLAQAPELDWFDWLKFERGVAVESMADLNRMWLGYVYGRSRQDQTPLPIPLPDQALQLVCRSTDAADATLYRYDPLTEELVAERVLNRPSAILYPMPDRQGVMVAEQGPRVNSLAGSFIWDGQTQIPISFGSNGLSAPAPISASPDGSRILFRKQDDRMLPYAYLDWPACYEQNECDLHPLLGAAPPQWSPNGQRMILYGNRSADSDWYMLFLADENGRETQYIAVGRAAAWLDDETAVFVREGGHVLAVDAVTLDLTPLFTVADLAASLEAERISRASLEIEFLIGQPENGQKILVSAIDNRSSYLFQFDRTDGTINPLFPQAFTSEILLPQVFPLEKRLSPDGRFLVQFVSGEDGQMWDLLLTEWETAVSQNYATIALPPLFPTHSIDWSADGQWLVLAADGYLRLIAPNHDFERWFIPKQMACDQAVWLNK